MKILWGTLISVIAGPGLLLFISEYATYTYALRIGIRPPLEGIPYLSATVALTGLFLSILAVVIFLLSQILIYVTYIYAISILHFFNQVKLDEFKKNSNENIIFKKIKEDPIIGILTIVISIGSVSVISFVLIGVFIETVFGIMLGSYVLIYMAIYFLVVSLTLWKKIFKYVVAVAFSIFFYMSSFYFLFDEHYYKSFLSFIKYGGGIKVTVIYKDNRRNENIILLLRTKEFIFIKNNKGSILEVPMKSIEYMSYPI